jgi:hypothetical protein
MSGHTISLIFGGAFVAFGVVNIARGILFKIRGRGIWWSRGIYVEAEDDGHDRVGFQTVVLGPVVMGVFMIVAGGYLILTAS